jgi:hypothetical protein
MMPGTRSRFRFRPDLKHLLATFVRLAGRPAVAAGALLLVASSATVVATNNAPPVVTNWSLSKQELVEGDTVTLNVTFADPDPNDLHTARIR